MRLVVALLCLACACSEAAPRALWLEVADEAGRGVGGSLVEIDGLPVTKTDAAGHARISLGAGPARARVAVRCPAGSREVSPRHVARDREGGSARLELAFVCRPSLRMLAIVVHAPNGAGSVLRADGEALGVVARDGTLHATLMRAPDSEVQLMLDTGELPLRPRNPLREHRMADRDELFVFDQPLLGGAPDRGPEDTAPKRVGRTAPTYAAFGGRR